VIQPKTGLVDDFVAQFEMKSDWPRGYENIAIAAHIVNER